MKRAMLMAALLVATVAAPAGAHETTTYDEFGDHVIAIMDDGLESLDQMAENLTARGVRRISAGYADRQLERLLTIVPDACYFEEWALMWELYALTRAMSDAENIDESIMLMQHWPDTTIVDEAAATDCPL